MVNLRNEYMSKAVVIASIILLMSSCFSLSFTGGSVPPEAKTFSVDYFPVRAALADPNYGQLLSESMKDLLLAQTRLNLVEQDGDIQFSGTVSTYRIQPVAAQGDVETASRNRLTIGVTVQYVSLTEEGKDSEFTISQFEDFLAADEFEAKEEELLDAINQKIIQDIYDKTLGDW